jgi:superfamily II DNA/RNA helicase
MSFEALNLAAPIQKAVALCGYAMPTPIQKQSIPQAMAGKDLIASAQTGTGKTAAFVIPALERLQKPSAARGKGPRVLVLTPTRELANQVTEAVRTYGKFLRLRHGAIVGGMPYFEQQRLLSQPVDIIIATPGRLIDHLQSGRIDFSRVELLVLDEADRMLDMGFSEAVETITQATPAGRQTLLFTATCDSAMERLAQRLLKDPVRIAVAGKKATLETIEQRLHAADDMQHKNRMLNHLIADSAMTRAIIFSSTKKNADQLARELNAQGHAAEALHGDMTQGARNRAIMNMRRGKVRLLVATDVAARGLDVPGITHVINFDLPKNAEDYVHRIGRTGRAGATGIAISFVSYRELDQLTRIERYIGQSLPQQVIAGLEPARPLRSSGGRTSRPGGASSNWRPTSASAGKRYAQPALSRDAYGATTGRKPHHAGAYAGERKRDAKQQGGWAGDYRKPQGDRRSRWQ